MFLGQVHPKGGDSLGLLAARSFSVRWASGWSWGVGGDRSPGRRWDVQTPRG